MSNGGGLKCGKGVILAMGKLSQLRKGIKPMYTLY